MAIRSKELVSTANRIVQEAVGTAIHEGGEDWSSSGGLFRRRTGLWTSGVVLRMKPPGTRSMVTLSSRCFLLPKPLRPRPLHIQAERGLVDYDSPIAHYWPEFAVHGKDKGTVRDALTHRIGIPQMPEGVTPELMCDWDWMVQQLADTKPLFEPGNQERLPGVHIWLDYWGDCATH